MLLVMLGIPSLSNAEDEWWFARTTNGTCLKSINEYDWLTPNQLVSEYGCKITNEVRSVVMVSCSSGELKNQNYAFSKNETMCKVFAKILYGNKSKKL